MKRFIGDGGGGCTATAAAGVSLVLTLLLFDDDENVDGLLLLADDDPFETALCGCCCWYRCRVDVVGAGLPLNTCRNAHNQDTLTLPLPDEVALLLLLVLLPPYSFQRNNLGLIYTKQLKNPCNGKKNIMSTDDM